MKKKIAFVISTFMIGGQEKALISMLNKIPKDKYDITILTLFDEGEFKEFIPDWVKIKIIPKNKSNAKYDILDKLKKMKFIEVIKDIYYIINIKNAKTKARHNYYTVKLFPNLEEEYDVIIHYHSTESFILHYVAYKTKAKAKIAWIHSDISNNLINDKDIFRDIYSRYNKIFSVSQSSLNKFVKVFPETKNKSEVFYNLLNCEEMNRLSKVEKGFDDYFNGIRILTVGRLCIDKRQDLIPHIVKKLSEEGYNIRWYIIGEGNTRDIIQQSINELNINDKLILLGSKLNPYPYMNECDIYVQPSQSEGLCTTVFEAQYFSKPMVVTDFNGIHEQVINGETGYIVPINDINEIYKAIKELIDNKSIYNKISYNLSQQEYSHADELKKLYSFIDSI